MKNKKNYILVGLLIIIIIGVIIVKYFYDHPKDNILTGKTNIGGSLIASSQSDVDAYLKKDLESNKYSLEKAKVYIDPYESSPLSAIILFYTDKKESVTVTVKGQKQNDLVLEYGEENYHYIPVFGLYNGYNNKVIVKLGSGTSRELTISIDDNKNLPKVTADTNNVTSDGDLYLLTSPLSMSSIGIDGYGDIRWYETKNYYHNIVKLENNHLLVGTDADTTAILPTRLLEIDYLGRIYNEYNIEDGYLNDFFVKQNGNIIVTGRKEGRVTISDLIEEIDAKTGKVVKEIDLFDLFSKIDNSFTSNITREDYFYNSGISYNEEDDSLLLTYWGGEMVVNLNYTSGTINWIFTNPENLPASFSKYLLKPTGNFTYPSSMHQATLNKGTLKVLDNGYSTIKNITNLKELKGSYSSANTYKIDGKNIELVSSYNENKKYFSYALGDYKVLNNEELILFGRELNNVNYNENVDINEYDNLSSKLIGLVNNNKVLDLTIAGGNYSVTKVNVNTKHSFNFDSPKNYTTLTASPKEELTSAILDKLKDAELDESYDFGFEQNIIENNMIFLSLDEVKMVLVNDSKEGAVYTIKEPNKEKVNKTVIDLPKGKYYIFIIENDHVKQTGKTIEVK